MFNREFVVRKCVQNFHSIKQDISILVKKGQCVHRLPVRRVVFSLKLCLPVSAGHLFKPTRRNVTKHEMKKRTNRFVYYCYYDN